MWPELSPCESDSGEAEYRELSQEEVAHLKTAAAPPLWGSSAAQAPGECECDLRT